MRKNSIFLIVAMLTTMAFAGSVMAQGQAKPAAPAATEKQAPAPEKQKATESTPMKKEAVKPMEASGSVATYEAGKMIKIKEKDKELSFDLTGSTMVKGEVKDGAKVTVMYKKEGEKMVATAITVKAEKKS